MTDSWTEWSGGECPVGDGAIVKILMRCQETNTGPAGRFTWDHCRGKFGYSGDFDIVAYRIVSDGSNVGDVCHKLSDWQCIVARDEAGDGWIIARSDFIRDRDVLMECSAEDNGFNRNWDSGLSVGVYLVTLKGWEHNDPMTGDIDCGVDVIECKPLWAVPEMSYRLGVA